MTPLATGEWCDLGLWIRAAPWAFFLRLQHVFGSVCMSIWAKCADGVVVTQFARTLRSVVSNG